MLESVGFGRTKVVRLRMLSPIVLRNKFTNSIHVKREKPTECKSLNI
jgi:hypothetical protein